MFKYFIWERVREYVDDLVKIRIGFALDQRGINTYRPKISDEDRDLGGAWTTCTEIPYHVPTHVAREIEKKTDDLHRSIVQLRTELTLKKNSMDNLAWQLGYQWNHAEGRYVARPKERRRRKK